MIQEKEVQSLRRLASRWMEHASSPMMGERRRQWRAVKDLAAVKPMILVETCMLPDYVGADELLCVDPFVRNIEKSLYEIVRHADEIGDDIVVEPWFRIPWVLEISDYGVPIEAHHAVTSGGSDLAYSFNFGVQSAKDAERLHLRNRCVNRRESFHQKELLEDIFGDILPGAAGRLRSFRSGSRLPSVAGQPLRRAHDGPVQADRQRQPSHLGVRPTRICSIPS